MKAHEKVGGQRPAEIKALRKELGEARKRETLLLEALQNLEAAFHKQGRDLGARIKNLECLVSISKLAQRLDLSLEQVLQDTVDQIPPASQHPEKTRARLILEGQELTSKDFQEGAWKESVDIEEREKRIGSLELHYLGKSQIGRAHV